jgi:hypothetical protein
LLYFSTIATIIKGPKKTILIAFLTPHSAS